MSFFFFLSFFSFTETTVFSRTGFAGHKCLQIQRHRQRCQCQCPVTIARCPALLFPAAYLMCLILQVFSTLLNKWPWLRACFQQTIWAHTTPTALQISPSLALCSVPIICLISDFQGDYWNLFHLPKV